MRATVFAIGFAATVVGSSAAYAASCNHADDHAAFHVRALQTDLMVAALTCDARHHYNGFVRKFQAELVQHGKALKHKFHRTHGSAQGEKQLNAYVTKLANRASARSSVAQDQYCEVAARTFSALSDVTAAELVEFTFAWAGTRVDVPSSCRPSLQLVDTTAQ